MTEKLQPLEDFVNHHVKGEWKQGQEFLLYNGVDKRFRITVETVKHDEFGHWGLGLWRDDKLAEQGISGACEDAKEFAHRLLETLFYHLSPHETEHIVRVLQEDLDKWQAERAAAYPETAGDRPCPY